MIYYYIILYYMPKGKYNRGKRGVYRKKNKLRVLQDKMPKSLIAYGFPRCQLVRMVYFAQVRLDPDGTPATHVFSANSVYDPDYTQTGHQPMYHDQYAAVYNKYKVVSSKIQITGANDYSDQANVMGNLITCVVNNTTTAYQSITEACEAKGARYSQCHERRPMKRLTSTFSAKKFFCLTNIKDADDIDGILGDTLVGSSPAQRAYFVVQAFPLYQAQNTYPACLNIRISYNVLVYDLKKQAGS